MTHCAECGLPRATAVAEVDGRFAQPLNFTTLRRRAAIDTVGFTPKALGAVGTVERKPGPIGERGRGISNIATLDASFRR